MDHFDIYKDLNLFLRKVYYKQIYTKEGQDSAVEENSTQNKEVVEQLISLLEVCDTASDDEEMFTIEQSRHKANL